MKYEILLFDADETLLDFKKAENDALLQVFSKYKIPSTKEVIDTYCEINDGLWKLLEEDKITKERLKTKRFEDFLARYKFCVDAKKISEDYISILSTKSYILDGAEKLCKELYGKCKMYIVTNGLKAVQQGRIFNCRVIKYFDGVFISEEIGYEKPKKEFFEIACGKIPGFNKSKAVIIGDSLSSDIQGGINFGIDTLWYNPSGEKCPEDKNITYIANELCEIPSMLGF